MNGLSIVVLMEKPCNITKMNNNIIVLVIRILIIG